MTPQELVSLCKTSILAHVEKGGKVKFTYYGRFDSTMPTKLANNCGCALSIACASLIEGAPDYEMTHNHIVTYIDKTLKIDSIQRMNFIDGFDSNEIRGEMSEAGTLVRAWVLENHYNIQE